MLFNKSINSPKWTVKVKQLNNESRAYIQEHELSICQSLLHKRLRVVKAIPRLRNHCVKELTHMHSDSCCVGWLHANWIGETIKEHKDEKNTTLKSYWNKVHDRKLRQVILDRLKSHYKYTRNNLSEDSDAECLNNLHVTEFAINLIVNFR